MIVATDVRLTHESSSQNTQTLCFEFGKDQPGILNRVTVVLFARGWDIIEAYSVDAEEAGAVKDIFVVEHVLGDSFSEDLAKEVIKEVTDLVNYDLSCVDYLKSMFTDLSVFSQGEYLLTGAQPITSELSEIIVEARDNPGVLMKITYQLDALGFDIVGFQAKNQGSWARDRFTIRYRDGQDITGKDLAFLQQLLNKELFTN